MKVQIPFSNFYLDPDPFFFEDGRFFWIWILYTQQDHQPLIIHVICCIYCSKILRKLKKNVLGRISGFQHEPDIRRANIRSIPRNKWIFINAKSESVTRLYANEKAIVIVFRTRIGKQESGFLKKRIDTGNVFKHKRFTYFLLLEIFLNIMNLNLNPDPAHRKKNILRSYLYQELDLEPSKKQSFSRESANRLC